MTAAFVGFWRGIRRNGVWLVAGVILTALGFNITAGPGVVITNQAEAEGPQFSDPSTLDLFSDIAHRRECPAQSQRWAWRWETYNGQRVQHAVPLKSTVAPFLAADGGFLLTIDAHDVPDPVGGGWQYRVVTVENCPWLPHVISQWFGPRLFRSPDLPVNFVGAPHAPQP